MSETPPNPSTQPVPSRPPRRHRWLLAVMIGVMGLFGFTAVKVHSSPWRHWAHHHRLDAEEVTFFIQHRFGRVLSAVDATQEQRDRINAIVKDTVKDVMALRKDRAAQREKVLAMFTADSIDRSALEALRAEKLALGDIASKRIVRAIADVAEVLNPEQRRQIAAEWERRHPLP